MIRRFRPLRQFFRAERWIDQVRAELGLMIAVAVLALGEDPFPAAGLGGRRQAEVRVGSLGRVKPDLA